MNSKLIKVLLLFVLAFTLGMGMMALMNKGSGKRMPSSDEITEFHNKDYGDQTKQKTGESDIAKLTAEDVVVTYIKQNKKLPDYYIRKSEARKAGWEPNRGNLCDVLPGRAIGGDYFGNREGQLPQKDGRKYFEADVNYDCGRRDAERLVFSNDGLIFTSKDHYKTFQQH